MGISDGFERAYATAPLPTPSQASLRTGLYPPRHGIRNNGDAILPEEATTLAEILSASGYRTAAAVSAFVTTEVWNLDQGFDQYFDDVTNTNLRNNRWEQERPAEQVVDDLIGWLQQTSESPEPFFIWAHFYDPHAPYKPPPPYDEMAHPYDGELAYTDAQLSRLKEAVEAAAGDQDVAWVVLADHGEALNQEHGESTHGMFVFDPTMRVPFIFQPPTPLKKPVVISDVTASIVDVMPTALSMLGQKIPEDIDGFDLSSATRGQVDARTGVYMESLSPQQRFGYHPEIALAEGPLKLIDTPSPQLFDVAQDPQESTNLIDQRTADVERLRKQAQAIWNSAAIAAAGDEISPETLSALAELGYINNDFEHGGELSTIDAKDRIDVISTLESIRVQNVAKREYAEAERRYKELLEKETSLAEARLGLGRVLTMQGKNAEAAKVYQEALDLQPSSTVLKVNLANAKAADGNHVAGLEMLYDALDQVPGDYLAQNGGLRLLSDSERFGEGIPLDRRWLQG